MQGLNYCYMKRPEAYSYLKKVLFSSSDSCCTNRLQLCNTSFRECCPKRFRKRYITIHVSLIDFNIRNFDTSIHHVRKSCHKRMYRWIRRTNHVVHMCHLIWPCFSRHMPCRVPCRPRLVITHGALINCKRLWSAINDRIESKAPFFVGSQLDIDTAL